MITRVSQMVFSIFLHHKWAFCPAMQISTNVYSFSEFYGRAHLAAHNTLFICPVGIPLPIVINENREVDTMSNVTCDFSEWASWIVAFQNIVTKSMGRGIHIECAIPINHFRCKGNQTGKLFFRHRCTLQSPIYQIIGTPAPDIRICTVQIVFTVIAQNERIRKVSVLFNWILVSIHRLIL